MVGHEYKITIFTHVSVSSMGNIYYGPVFITLPSYFIIKKKTLVLFFTVELHGST